MRNLKTTKSVEKKAMLLGIQLYLEFSKCASSFGVNNSLWNSLSVEMRQEINELEVS